jgi:hypothetical protein
MYSSSATVGDFENYIAHDVVAYIDQHYRTIPNRMSRGLVGHSMGGYGATDWHEAFRCIRQLVHHESVLPGTRILLPQNSDLAKTLEAVKTPEESAKLSFGARATLASAAAWSPNPMNPPLYLDLPTKDGETQPAF